VTETMHWFHRLAQLDDAKRRAERAEEEGARYGPLLLAALPGSWRKTMRSDAHYRSYGTLMYLLGRAREKFSTEPTTAYEITSVVCDFVNEIDDAPSHIAAVGIRGLASKEHANAALQRGEVTEALEARAAGHLQGAPRSRRGHAGHGDRQTVHGDLHRLWRARIREHGPLVRGWSAFFVQALH